VTNAGTTGHELEIIKGDSFEALPKTATGAVDEKALPSGALVRVADRFSPGTTANGSATLAPGTYVLLCNLVGAGTSHAAKGQHLVVTVTS
jgi:hypothetical protein